MSENINPIYHMMYTMDVADWVVAVAAILIVIFLIIGIVRKTFWMCGIAIVLAIGIFFANPAGYEEMKDTLIDFFDDAISPMEDDDYSDLIGEDIDEVKPGSNFGEIGRD